MPSNRSRSPSVTAIIAPGDAQPWNTSVSPLEEQVCDVGLFCLYGSSLLPLWNTSVSPLEKQVRDVNGTCCQWYGESMEM
jgi:hypothetical protein